MTPDARARVDAVLQRFEEEWRPDVVQSLPELVRGLPPPHREAAALDLLLVDLERRYGVGLTPRPECDYAALAREDFWTRDLAVRLAAADRRWRDILNLDVDPGWFATLLSSEDRSRAEGHPARRAGDPVLRVWPLAAGAVFGRYRVDRPLGAGQMGSVYHATDPLLRRAVALKVPRRV